MIRENSLGNTKKLLFLLVILSLLSGLSFAQETVETFEKGDLEYYELDFNENANEDMIEVTDVEVVAGDNSLKIQPAGDQRNSIFSTSGLNYYPAEFDDLEWLIYFEELEENAEYDIGIGGSEGFQVVYDNQDENLEVSTPSHESTEDVDWNDHENEWLRTSVVWEDSELTVSVETDDEEIQSASVSNQDLFFEDEIRFGVDSEQEGDSTVFLDQILAYPPDSNFEIDVSGSDTASPDTQQQYTAEITNTGSIPEEPGLLFLKQNDEILDSVNVGELQPDESVELSEIAEFEESDFYQICGEAPDVDEESCMTVDSTFTVDEDWRDAVSFTIDLTGPDSGLGWDMDSSWDGDLQDYSSTQFLFEEDQQVVYTDIYWQETYQQVDNEDEDLTEEDTLDVHYPPMCGDDQNEYLLEEMGESIHSEQFEGRYSCTDENYYCVYRGSGPKIFEIGDKVNTNEDGEQFGRFKNDQAVCAQRPGLSDTDMDHDHDLVPMWYDQDYANHIRYDQNADTTIHEDRDELLNQNLCRENNLFGDLAHRWIPFEEIAEHPHAFTGGIDDAWNPRLNQMNHPYYISDPGGEYWDHGENPFEQSHEDHPGAEGFSPVDTGTHHDKVPVPTNMDYGFCAGDDASEYVVHQESQTRFVDDDNSVRGVAASPDSCVLANDRDETNTPNEQERMIYDEGDSETVRVEDGEVEQDIFCFGGQWWGDWPVVFLEDQATTQIGETSYSPFRVINPETTERTFELDLVLEDDVENIVSFASTNDDEMEVDVPGESSRTFNIELEATNQIVDAFDDNRVELQAVSKAEDLNGYDDINVIVQDSEVGESGQVREIPGLQLAQIAVIGLIASIVMFFTS